MSKTCDAGNGCSITCPVGCYAMWSGGQCYKGCSGATVERVELHADDRINISVNDLPLSAVATLLGFVEEVPEADRSTIISLDVKNASVAEVIRLVRDRVTENA